MKKDIEYEKFTQEIYQSLINVQGLTTIEVKHNIKIKGRSGQEHQIDVYWEYVIAEIRHKVAIECKNYNSVVSVGKVRDFYGVLADIGNINGIMVTKEGYQKGSKEFAKHYGINLKELREPKDDDWKGRIKTIVVNMEMVLPKIKSRFIIVDEEWVRANIKLPENETFNYSIGGMADELWVLDSNENRLKNFNQLDQELPQNWKAEKDLEHFYNFDDGYIKVEKFGKIKIKSIQYRYDVNISFDEELIINGQKIAKAILKDALTGEIKFFNKDGTIK
ncbi:restriction endonuclease [Arcicella aquatica]|uniref:Restriction endonuclease n=1 Tax=Arcicella aquatica TaxID=217141 RepID=A0ABU5QKA8_9BACT|nr:restriction endonuclease [Arcicella aquatica]MEA5257493.1 restriction endonuclease [Arcicella aquatica]